MRSVRTTVSPEPRPVRRGVSKGSQNQLASSAYNIADNRTHTCQTILESALCNVDHFVFIHLLFKLLPLIQNKNKRDTYLVFS